MFLFFLSPEPSHELNVVSLHVSIHTIEKKKMCVFMYKHKQMFGDHSVPQRIFSLERITALVEN